MKKYFHEDSPFDDIFKGAKSYNEALSRIQTLSDKEKSYFLNFQKHGRSCLPNILQVEKIFTRNGNPVSDMPPYSNRKQHDFPRVKTKEDDKTLDASSKYTIEKEQNLTGKTLQETWEMFEAFMKHGHIFPQITSNTETPLKDISTQGKSIALTSPTTFLTPLASNFEIHGS